MQVICKQKLSVLETKQRWNARRWTDVLQFPSLKVSCTVKLSSIMKWFWLEFSSAALLGTSKVLLNNACFTTVTLTGQVENARLHLESACKQKCELILDGVV